MHNTGPIIAGWVHNWHISLLAIVLSLVISVLLYAVSLAACAKAPDYRSPGELLALHEVGSSWSC